MPWTQLLCILLGCEHGRTKNIVRSLCQHQLTGHTQDHTHTHTHASMHTHKRVNALTQTRESPMERLFRGITWLLGNSVALPRRPSYFRLLICLFLCVCLRVCLSSIHFFVPIQHGYCPILFFLYTSILHASVVCVCLCVCLCVCYCEWSAGEVMWVDVVRQGH